MPKKIKIDTNDEFIDLSEHDDGNNGNIELQLEAKSSQVKLLNERILQLERLITAKQSSATVNSAEIVDSTLQLTNRIMQLEKNLQDNPRSATLSTAQSTTHVTAECLPQLAALSQAPNKNISDLVSSLVKKSVATSEIKSNSNLQYETRSR